MVSTMRGVIRHRILLNYAAEPDVVAPLLPSMLRPQVVNGKAVVGVCILRLAELRPDGLPSWVGLHSDDAAHRIAVEWDGLRGVETGVYVLRRDAHQRLPVMAGGRLFPGVHGRADFVVEDDGTELHVSYRTKDHLDVEVTASPLGRWTSGLFETPRAASEFFAAGSRGFSPTRRGCMEGIEMTSDSWRAEPVGVVARSSFYDDPTRFPAGSIQLDGALLMRDIAVEWTRTEFNPAG